MTQYMTGSFICRLIGLRDVSRHDSILEKKIRNMLVTWFFARSLTWCLHNAIVAAIGRNWNCSCSSHATMVSPSIARIKHGFVWLSVRLSYQLYKLKPIASTSDMTWHLECERDFEVSRNCKTTTLFFRKRTTKNTEGKDRRTPDAPMHCLHICCTMRMNDSFVIHGNAEFFGCGMRKSDNV